jgi:N-acetylneuraminate lyase
MDPEIQKFVIHDLAAATFVPYNEDGSVNYGGVDAHCKDLAVHGVMFAFVNGTTGDSMILREEERKLLSEAWVAAGKKYGVKIVNHVGAQGLQETCELARHAQASGCDAISVMPPQFFKTNGAKGLALWLQAVGKAAPKMPIY